MNSFKATASRDFTLSGDGFVAEEDEYMHNRALMSPRDIVPRRVSFLLFYLGLDKFLFASVAPATRQCDRT